MHFLPELALIVITNVGKCRMENLLIIVSLMKSITWREAILEGFCRSGAMVYLQISKH